MIYQITMIIIIITLIIISTGDLAEDGAEVRQQAASGIILSNLTLVLQRVSR